jgi:hypothetical protein
MTKFSNITYSFYTKLITIIGIIVMIFGLWVYWNYILNSPKNLFNSAIENSMRTRGFTRQSDQSNASQAVLQKLRLQLGQFNDVHAQSSLIQGSLENPDAIVQTESIGTKSSDFVRYSSIQTSQKNEEGLDFDFSNVVGIWGRSENRGSDSEGELFGEISLGVVPAGYMDRSSRLEILNFIKDKNVYEVDYNNVTKTRDGGRLQYIYQVRVKPALYVEMLRLFSRTQGFSQLDDLDPAQYNNSAPLQFEISVDMWSRQLTRIVHKDSGRIENFEAHGAIAPVQYPESSIPLNELQERLQTIR